MKKALHLFVLCMVSALTISVATAQSNRVDVRFNVGSADCINNTLPVEVQMRLDQNSSLPPQNSELYLAGATLRFTYNTNALALQIGNDGKTITSPTLQQVSDATSTTLIFNNSTVSYGFTQPVSNGPSDSLQPDGSWTTMGILTFDILDYSQCGNLDWNVCDDNDFPCTYASEYIGPTNSSSATTQPFNLEEHLNASACLVTVCNFPPDAQPTQDLDNDDEITIVVEKGQDSAFCIPVSNLPGDQFTTNVMSIISGTNSNVGVFTITNAFGPYCVNFESDDNNTGNTTAIIQVCDNGNPSLCDNVTINFVVNDGNLPPIGIPDINNTLINTPVVGNVLTNDLDPENEDLDVVGFGTNPVLNIITTQGGTISLNVETGMYTYNPPTDFVGTDDFTYTVVDPQGATDINVLVSIVVVDDEAGDRNPVANLDAALIYVGQSAGGNATDNDFDPDGDNIRVTPANKNVIGGNNQPVGTFSIDANGDWTYSRIDGFIGTDICTYELCDLDDQNNPVNCVTGFIVIEIIADENGNGNDPPFAADDAFFVTANQTTPISGNVLVNDYDPNAPNTNNGTINTNAVILNPPAASKGTLTWDFMGGFTYVPFANATGTETVTYTIQDQGNPALMSTATLTILIVPQGEAPKALDDIAVGKVNEQVCGNVLVNDFDAEGGDLTVSLLPGGGLPFGWGLTLNADGDFCVFPPTNFVGEETFTYVVCDDENPSQCDTAVVYIEITDGTKIVANPDYFQVYEHNNFITNVSAAVNDLLLPGLDLNEVTYTTIQGPSNSAFFNLVGNGDVTYAPADNFIGLDTAFYRVCESSNSSNCDESFIVFEVLPNDGENARPVALSDAGYTPFNTSISIDALANDTDPDPANTPNGTISFAPGSITDGSNGTVALVAGELVYTPFNGFEGNDTFSYTICDNGSPQLCASALVYIVVENEIIAPVAIGDIVNGEDGETVLANVLTNDFTLDNDNIVLVEIVDQGNSGNATVNNLGQFSYDPFDPNFAGVDVVTYRICDDGTPVACDTASVSIEYYGENAGNDNPIANRDYYFLQRTPANGQVTANILNNDFDPDGDVVSYVALLSPFSNALPGTNVNGAGVLTYRPVSGFLGLDTASYQITDGNGGTDVALIIIEVVEPADNGDSRPFAGDDAFQGLVDNTISGNVAANDYDPGNTGGLSYTLIQNPSNGNLNGTFNPFNGTFTYTPAPGFIGTDEFVYMVCDQGNNCDFATVQLIINPVAQICVSPRVFLEGPWNGSDMDVTQKILGGSANFKKLQDCDNTPGYGGNNFSVLPLSQPYNTNPWNYNGNEAVNAVTDFSLAVVDWVLVELRDSPSKNDVVARYAGLLHEDGLIYNIDGTTSFCFDGIDPGRVLHTVIRHRNHLPVMDVGVPEANIPSDGNIIRDFRDFNNPIGYKINPNDPSEVPQYTLTTSESSVECPTCPDVAFAMFAGNGEQTLFGFSQTDINDFDYFEAVENITLSQEYNVYDYFLGCDIPENILFFDQEPGNFAVSVNVDAQ